jgi:chromate transporter
VVLALAVAFSGVAGFASAQGALRGMGAVAAGLITATGLKLVGALQSNVMGMRACWAFAASVFVAIALLRWPLVWVLLGAGSLAFAWAWRQLDLLKVGGARA